MAEYKLPYGAPTRKPNGILVGERFGDLLVIGEAEAATYENSGKKIRALCRCNCGEICSKDFYHMRKGRTKDCGCKSMRSKKTVIPVGTKFGKLTTIAPNYRDGSESKIPCVCECGKEVDALLTRVLRGTVAGCFGKGCGGREKHEMHRTSEYGIWQGIKSRTSRPSNPVYSSYGGRGIKMHKEWFDSFEAFYADMGPRPSKGHSVDRIDVNGNYEPSNCRWATATEQANNRRNSIRIHLRGERVYVKDIVDSTCLSSKWLYAHLKENELDIEATIRSAIEGLERYLKV